jgi:Uma2 family endonuclease
MGVATHAARTTTAEELLRLPDDSLRRELIEGRVRVMAPAGWEHGRVALTAGRLLSSHVHERGIGVTCAAETGFVLARDPDTVRAPDAAYVTQEHVDAIGRTVKYWPHAPDFAVEVISPDDTRQEVRGKALAWLRGGTMAVLVLDPPGRTATVYRSPDRITRYGVDDEIDLSDAVPGWRVAVAEFFE